jgi:hypothetical protein
VSVRRFKVRRRADGTYRQKVTLTNTGAGALQPGDQRVAHRDRSRDLAGGLREIVLRICLLWQHGRIPPEVCDDVLRELAAIGRIRSPRALLFRLFLNRGFDLDTMIVPVPENLVSPKGN